MKVEDYPRFTIIMRGYTYEQAYAVLTAMSGLEKEFAVEITLNTLGAIEHINKLSKLFGETILIGAGTVRTLPDAQKAVAAGARFLLGPHRFTKQIMDFARKEQVLSVPAAMSPSEINEMFTDGADIVKVFPAAVVTPRFFTDVQAPLGKLPLMGVGGISISNAKEYFDHGASYLGLGSNLFQSQDLQAADPAKLALSLQKLATEI